MQAAQGHTVLDRLAPSERLGPVGEVQEREPIEFPDRPGL
jgi:hypothetical protein